MWEKILEWIQTMVAKIAVFVNKFTESKQRIADLDLTFKKVMAGKKDKLDTASLFLKGIKKEEKETSMLNILS
jgi:hypothetical protein